MHSEGWCTGGWQWITLQMGVFRTSMYIHSLSSDGCGTTMYDIPVHYHVGGYVSGYTQIQVPSQNGI